VAAVVVAVVAMTTVVTVATIVAVGADAVEEEVVGCRLTTGRFSSFSANPWIMKARPFKVGSLYTS
jgi:hypothetical protein